MNILAIDTHPDDIELECGGTLLKASRQGHSIFMYTLTRGGSAGQVIRRSNELVTSAKSIEASTLWIDDFNITRHIAFRNYIYSHEDVAKVYENLKLDLAKKYPNDINSYTNGKDKFIKEIEKKTIDWYTKH